MIDSLHIYLDKDINTELIKTKKIAVIGFGSQGYGQSMNLKDSGCDVVLGLRLGGKSDEKAKKYGFKTMSIEDAYEYCPYIDCYEEYEGKEKEYAKSLEYIPYKQCR